MMIGLTVQLKIPTSKPLSTKTSMMRTTTTTVHSNKSPSYPQMSRFPTLATKNDSPNTNDREPVGSDGGDGKRNGRWILGGIKWGDLVLSPDPDNVAAVGLTGLLTWASVQVLWQLLFISAAILVAAVKYSLIAALLIFILITLL